MSEPKSGKPASKKKSSRKPRGNSGAASSAPSAASFSDISTPADPNNPQELAEALKQALEYAARNSQDLNRELPVMTLVSVVVFPVNVLSFIVRKAHNLQLIRECGGEDAIVCLIGQRDLEQEKPTSPKDLYSVGVAAKLVHSITLPDGSIQVTFQGLHRVRLNKLTAVDPYLQGVVAPIKMASPTQDDGVKLAALMSASLELFERLVQRSPAYSQELLTILRMNMDGPDRFADLIASFVNFSLPQKFELLALAEPRERMVKLLDLLEGELKRLIVESDVQREMKQTIEKSQREFLLRQQLNAVRKELGEFDQGEAEMARLRERMLAANLPEVVRAKAEEELRRLETINPASAEYSVARTYIDWLLVLPWNHSSEDQADIRHAREVLDAGHFGLKDVKERIIEFLAVMRLRGKPSGSILCLLGPPGVGKTSLGRSVADALGRKFQRISVGGLRDDAEIMGHRRTYVGALPGKIIDALKRAETNNPVLMIDEIDKMGSDSRGDPASAMLEVLDPEQNANFNDRYLDMPFDLSKVLFICTANYGASIPRPLRDRMEVIELPGYSRQEKFEIARRHLLARQVEVSGLRAGEVALDDDALFKLIDDYTREAGVRNLERRLGAICRKIAVKIASNGRRSKVRVKEKNLADYTGRAPFKRDPRLQKPHVGVSTGMVWSPVGGDILFIEATKFAGSGKLIFTGSLGDVMRESVQAALSYVRAHAPQLKIDAEVFAKTDIHLHFPEGATPKDGPSAGCAIATAIVSLFTGKPVDPEVAMTGEITLRGDVLPVGGILQKVLGAHRAGIKRIVLPEANRQDLEDIPEEVRSEVAFTFARHVSTNLKVALLETDGANAASQGKAAPNGKPPAKRSTSKKRKKAQASRSKSPSRSQK